MMPCIDADLATSILSSIDYFAIPTNRLAAVIGSFDDDKTRKRMPRHLGNFKGLLEGEIEFEARSAFRQMK